MSFRTWLQRRLTRVLQIKERRFTTLSMRMADLGIGPWSCFPLQVMSKRLQCSEARRCSQRQIGSETGGLGGAFLNKKGKLVSWFGLKLESDFRKLLGSWNKDTLIYELELCAAVLFINLWCRGGYNLHVSFGDNESVRCALIKASRTGAAAGFISQMKQIEILWCGLHMCLRKQTQVTILRGLLHIPFFLTRAIPIL